MVHVKKAHYLGFNLTCPGRLPIGDVIKRELIGNQYLLLVALTTRERGDVLNDTE